MRSYEELETAPKQFQEHTYRVLRDLGACSLALQWVATWAPANEGETYGEYLQRYWRKVLEERGAVDWAIWLYCKAHFGPNDYNSLERRYLAAVFCLRTYGGFSGLLPQARGYLRGKYRPGCEEMWMNSVSGVLRVIALGTADDSAVHISSRFAEVFEPYELLHYFPTPPDGVFLHFPDGTQCRPDSLPLVGAP